MSRFNANAETSVRLLAKPDEHLRIVAPTRYPWTFNGPRQSRHSIDRRRFLPFNYINKKLDGITFLNPLPRRGFDLVHGFNRIVLDGRPYVIGFESHLPRAFGLENTRYFEYLSRDLASPRCRGIIAISDYARAMFERTHAKSPWREELKAKLVVRYPNLPMSDVGRAEPTARESPIRLLFVGNHFARKGGCVAMLMAEKALRRGIPLVVDVVSALEVGGAIWSDPVSTQFFERYLALLALPNVRWHGQLANERVVDLMRNSHFSVLTTFSDTFGYSAIESMTCGTPVIGTRQCALMEFLVDRENAIALELPLNEDREWREICPRDKASERYERVFAREVERLSEDALERVVDQMQSDETYRAMRTAARRTVTRLFDAEKATVFWDDLYEVAVRGGIARPAREDADHGKALSLDNRHSRVLDNGCVCPRRQGEQPD